MPFSPEHFVTTMMANLNNIKLSDSQFRDFIRNSVPTHRTTLKFNYSTGTFFVDIQGTEYTLLPGSTTTLTYPDNVGHSVSVYITDRSNKTVILL